MPRATVVGAMQACVIGSGRHSSAWSLHRCESPFARRHAILVSDHHARKGVRINGPDLQDTPIFKAYVGHIGPGLPSRWKIDADPLDVTRDCLRNCSLSE